MEKVFAVDVNLHPAFSWASQAAQYAASGPAGISLESHWIDGNQEVFPADTAGGAKHLNSLPHVARIDCLLHREPDGTLSGILNHYDGKNPLEELHAVNIWVRPDRQRQGIATALWKDAVRRWPEVTYDKQRYTESGLKWLMGLIEKGEILP